MVEGGSCEFVPHIFGDHSVQSFKPLKFLQPCDVALVDSKLFFMLFMINFPFGVIQLGNDELVALLDLLIPAGALV